MEETKELITTDDICSKVYIIRGQQVMLDKDLAELYGLSLIHIQMCIRDRDESHGKVLTHEQSAKSNGVCLATVTNTVKKYFEGGIDAVTEFKRNVNSDNARRVLCLLYTSRCV